MTEITRKLATIRSIRDVQPIDGADSIELVFVDGWQVVTRKGEFKVNDRCIYFEIDSFLPIHPLFEFLRASSFRDIAELGQGFRLKSIKLRKQLSQGLVLPLIETMKQFGDYVDESLIDDDPFSFGWTNGVNVVPFVDGADCTEYLGVKKFEIPLSAQLAGMVRGSFPSFIPKTDQERVQNLIFHDGVEFEQVFHDGEGKEIRVNKAPRPGPRQFDYEVTLKLDGSSMTVYKKDGYVGVCSRNMDLNETEGNAYWKCARASGLIDFLEQNDIPDIAFQGELMGPGVQGNREGLSELRFYLFDIYVISIGKYLDPIRRKMCCDELISETNVTIFHAPILLSHCSGSELTQAICLELAKGSSINHKVREGVVFKSNIRDETYSFKTINNDFLLGEK